MIVNVMLWYFFRLLEFRGDTEFNPGPKSDSSQSFSVCQWNLNSMSAHNNSKISLLTTYMYLYMSTADVNDGNLKIPGYIMYRVDDPSDVKRGAVCICYKTMLPLKVFNKFSSVMH